MLSAPGGRGTVKRAAAATAVIGAAIAVGPGAADAEPRTITVTLLGGAKLTLTVDVPPGTPLDQIRIPGLQGPIVGISDSGPVAGSRPACSRSCRSGRAGGFAGCGAWFA